MQLTEKAGV